MHLSQTQTFDEIGTREAARRLRLHQRTVQRLCDEGVLREGEEWRRNPSRSGLGHYKIQARALLRLLTEF